MYSMDDVFKRMQAFAEVLAKFQQALEASLVEMSICHGEVDSLWQDEARRFYDLHYGPLHEMLLKYSRIQGPEYLDFLEKKLQAIEAYLYGYRS
jgi:hypothetical protein